MNMMNNNTIGGIIINARDVTERKRLEERLAAEQKKHQREMTSAVIRAQETERSQLGRELHDNINQVLTTVKLYTEMIYDGIGDQKELIRKAGHHLQSCIDEIRSISKRLSAPTLGAISLEDSIKELVESINLTNRIEIIYNGTDISGLEIPQDIHLAIYRIIQEQLNNVLKYASASLVFITLKRNDNRVTLHITDNGKGFDLMARRTGIGITNMRTRAENLSGSFFINSAPEKGCQLQVSFPLQEV
jgi:signal transduction histidine kinase